MCKSVCLLSYGFQPRNFPNPYSEVTPCLYFRAMFAVVYVPRKKKKQNINMLQYIWIKVFYFLLEFHAACGFMNWISKGQYWAQSNFQRGRQKVISNALKINSPHSASVRFAIPFTYILLRLLTSYLFGTIKVIWKKNITYYVYHLYYTNLLSRNTGTLKEK